MSYSIYLSRFESGDVVPLDAETLRRHIAPYAVKQKPEYGFTEIHTDDGGEAELYALPEPDGALLGIAVTRFTSGAVLELVAQFARSLGAVVVLQEGVALVPDRDWIEHLHPDLRSTAQVIEFTGAGIEAAIGRV